MMIMFKHNNHLMNFKPESAEWYGRVNIQEQQKCTIVPGALVVTVE